MLFASDFGWLHQWVLKPGWMHHYLIFPHLRVINRNFERVDSPVAKHDWSPDITSPQCPSNRWRRIINRVCVRVTSVPSHMWRRIVNRVCGRGLHCVTVTVHDWSRGAHWSVTHSSHHSHCSWLSPCVTVISSLSRVKALQCSGVIVDFKRYHIVFISELSNLNPFELLMIN